MNRCAGSALSRGSGRPCPAWHCRSWWPAALRAGTVQADGDGERALLDALVSADEGPLEVGGLSAAATYHAASGRRCRRITGGDARLACEGQDGAWVFVPDVLSAEAQ